MDRRTFNKIVGLGTVGSMGRPAESWGQGNSSKKSTAGRVKLPSETYRRLLVDTHVPDWDPQLLARFDPADCVATIAHAGFQSHMQYANSHVGLCLWRTKIGHMHANMNGRDYFGEVMQECSRQGLHKLAYYSLIFDDWAFEHHPDWRILPADGYDRILQGRYGVVCPNSPYRGHALACLRELVGNYDFEGIFLDMTFWPEVCYCPHCTARFWREYKAELPRIVDWDEPTWRNFQKARQQWLFEFAKAVTSTIKETRPVTVYQQFATIFQNWKLGVPLELAEAMDFVGGDFYGGPAQYSLVCKAYNGLTQVRPFEFMTSRTSDIRDHVTIKPIEQIRIESFVPTVHSAALLLIDAINPDGTLNHAVYEFLAKLNAERAPYEPFLGGELLADIAIYYDKESMYNPDLKGVEVSKLRPLWEESDRSPHLDAVVGLARILREGHIPYGVVTNANLQQLGKYRAVMVPNVFEMTTSQAARFRKFVQDGGSLYASGPSSLDRFASGSPRFLLEDVLGVQYSGRLGTKITYLTPKNEGVKNILWPQGHLSYAGSMVRARVLPGSEVLGTLTLPFVPPEEGHAIGAHFAAIHSNPPALTPGTDPALVMNSFGKGRAVWVSAPVEVGSEAVNAKLILSLLKRVLPGPYYFEVETHPSVEMTLFHQAEKKRLLAGLLSMQAQLPSISVAATVRVQVPSARRAARVLRLPDRKDIRFENVGPYVQFRLEQFDTLAMVLVEYE